MVAPMDAARTSAHLTDAQRAALRIQLDEVVAAQTALLDESRREIDALIGHNDPDSLAERDLLEAASDVALAALTDAARALDRFDGGTYGRCEDCGSPIAPERLEVLPHTRFCVACPRLRPSVW